MEEVLAENDRGGRHGRGECPADATADDVLSGEIEAFQRASHRDGAVEESFGCVVESVDLSAGMVDEVSGGERGGELRVIDAAPQPGHRFKESFQHPS